MDGFSVFHTIINDYDIFHAQEREFLFCTRSDGDGDSGEFTTALPVLTDTALKTYGKKN